MFGGAKCFGIDIGLCSKCKLGKSGFLAELGDILCDDFLICVYGKINA